jgi:hypothetical protein
MAKAKLNAEQLELLSVKARLKAALGAVRSHKRDIGRLEHLYGESLNFNDDLAAAITALPTTKPAKMKVPQNDNQPVVATLCIGDWHIGGKVLADEMAGYNAFNYRIANARGRLLTGKVLEWVDECRSARPVNDLHVVGLGDFIEGELREEAIRRNEFTVPESVVACAEMMAKMIWQLGQGFQTVTMDMIGADNHGRLGRKPQSADKARNNYNYLIYDAVKARLSNMANLTMNLHLPTRAQFKIAGRSVLAEHGDACRAWMGIPFYGLERSEGREARKRLKKGQRYTQRLVGHWHTPWKMSFGIGNGALCGSTEYDAEAGRHAEPSQTSFLMHPRHGVFNYIEWNLEGAK